ncbi:unnamed protein product [Parascedosporium putredinis]|uniref:Uncharacterized protein n=1 Tax=Parascedosporium putredinis TaxID=1442378 RepID=A0A9P1H9B4_9PEZI|nr:unnamed protein product [Parascedosporium putredinis]CAI8001724.1 unnamed protein product [Parascedosporium putredinis]
MSKRLFFEELYDPQSRGLVPNLDLVLVHGIDGDPALCFAENERANEDYDYIASATQCIVFFGTPHFTSKEEQITALAKSFLPLDKTTRGKRGKVSPLVNSLIEGASDLADISEDFVEVVAKIPMVVSFYESLTWPGERFCIVDRSRAAMMIKNEVREPVDANHVEMCQFKDSKDPTFKSLSALFKKWKAMETPFI